MPAGVPGLDDQGVDQGIGKLGCQWGAVAVFDFGVIVGQLQQRDVEIVVVAGLTDVLFAQVETVEAARCDDFYCPLQAHRLRLMVVLHLEAIDKRVGDGKVVGIGYV
ncbi:hypothetical protein D3C73_1187110 [compost metagenome]